MELRFGKVMMFDTPYKLEALTQALGEKDKAHAAEALKLIAFNADRKIIEGGAKVVTANVLIGRTNHRKKSADGGDDSEVGLVAFLVLRIKLLQWLNDRYPLVREDVRMVFKNIDTFEESFPSDARRQQLAANGQRDKSQDLAWMQSLTGLDKLYKELVQGLFNAAHDDDLKESMHKLKTCEIEVVLDEVEDL